MRRTIVWLFHALLFFVPFAFTAVNSELFEFNKMMLVYAGAVVIGAGWLIRMSLEKRIIWRTSPLTWPILIFLTSQFLSTIFSINPHTSIFGYYSRFHGGLLSSLSYVVLLFAATSNLTKADLKPLIRTTLIAAILVCLYAIPEHFGVSPSCVLITGEFSVSCWVQDVQTRVFATFGQPNWLAAYLLMTIPLALWYSGEEIRFFAAEKKKSVSLLALQLWPLMAVFLFVTTLMYTRSRSGFLALLAELGILFAGGAWYWWRRERKMTLSLIKKPLTSVSGMTIAYLSLIVLTVLVVGSPYHPSLAQVVARRAAVFQSAPPAASNEVDASPTTASAAPAEPAATPAPQTGGTVLENGGTNSGTIRAIVWRGALAVWRRYPWFGSGVETFAYSYYLDRPMEHNFVSEWDFLYNKAHNEFLNTLATTGGVGLASLLLLMGMFSFFLIRDIWRADDTSLLALALFSSYVALAISNALGFSTVMVALLFFVWKAFWFLNSEQEESHVEESPSVAFSSFLTNFSQKPNKKTKKIQKTSDDHIDIDLPLEWIGAAGIALVALFFLGRLAQSWDNDRLFALEKAHASGGDASIAYATIQTLVTRAPNEPEYWDEASYLYARFAASLAESNATNSAEFTQAAVAASDQAIRLNPHHLNYWKTRARVLLLLSAIDAQFQERALTALLEAQKMAPNDPKLRMNTALVLDALQRPDEADAAFQDTLKLKPDYEQARTAYAQFLEKHDYLKEAVEQYRYILDHLSATSPTALERLPVLEKQLAVQ